MRQADVEVEIVRDERASDMPFGPESALPSRFTAWIDDASQPFVLALDIAVVGTQRPAVLGVFIRWRDFSVAGGVTSAGLRAVRLASAERQALEAAAFAQPRTDIGADRYTVPGDPPGTFHGGGVLSPGGKPGYSGPGRGRRMDDAFLELVATTYREAIGEGRHAPVEVVRKRYSASRSTAGRWVAQARHRGFLGPAIDRKAGEVQQPGTRRASRPRKDK